MAKLLFSERLFTGALILFAEEAAGTSDELTKPAADNAAWKELAHCEILKHIPKLYAEDFSKPTARGWGDGKDEFTLADVFDLTTMETCELHHRLAEGVADPIALGTAQTPGEVANRMVRGWIKAQHRNARTGQDRGRWDRFVEVRMKEIPATEKKIQKPILELWQIDSTLNTFVMPTLV